jgi:hypothetical protein
LGYFEKSYSGSSVSFAINRMVTYKNVQKIKNFRKLESGFPIYLILFGILHYSNFQITEFSTPGYHHFDLIKFEELGPMRRKMRTNSIQNLDYFQ